MAERRCGNCVRHPLCEARRALENDLIRYHYVWVPPKDAPPIEREMHQVLARYCHYYLPEEEDNEKL